MDQETKDLVVKSITALASVCDHAMSVDGQGFSKATAGPGHEIAAMGSDRWTPDFWDYATRLSAHHSRQLEKGGRLGPEEGERLRQAVRSASAAAPDIPTCWAGLAEADGRAILVVSVPSDHRLAAVFRNLPEEDVYRPAGSGRLWRVSEAWAFAVRPFLDGLGRLGEGVDEAVENSWQASTPERRMIATDLPVVRWDEGRGMFLIPFSYDREFVAEAKRHGGSFEKGESWKDCTAFLPADRIGAAFVGKVLGDGKAAVLHPDAVGHFEEAKSTEPLAATLAASQAPKLTVDGPHDGRLRVSMTRYDAGLIQAVKSVPGRAWDGTSWSIPATVAAAEALASSLDGLSAPEAAEAAAALREKAAELGGSSAPVAELKIEDRGGKFATVTMTGYVRPWVDAIRGLPKKDRRYDADTKAWQIRKDEETLSELAARLRETCGREGAPAWLESGASEVQRFMESIGHSAPAPRM